MTTISERVYSIEFFEKVLENGFDYQLPELTMSIINKISSQVGDPTYIKTPIFKKQERHIIGRKKRGKGQKPLSDEQWEVLRNFEKTKIEKNEDGIHKYINQLRDKLNKLTDKTYNDVIFEVKQIMSDMKEIMKPQDNKIIHNMVFDICSGNTFYSKIFTQLYVFMLKTYPELRGEFVLRFNHDPVLVLYEFDKKHNMEELYETYSKTENYDDLCKLNSIHDKKQALCKFLGNLVSNNMFDKNVVYKFIDDLIEEFEANIDAENNTRKCEDLVEIIYEIIASCKEYISVEDADAFGEIKEEIEMLTELKTKEHSSLTNKCAFKCMDLLDALNGDE